MSAVDFNESSILISAKLDEVKTVKTINSQLKNLKIDPIELEVSASKIDTTKYMQQIKGVTSRLQQEAVIPQYSIPFDFDIKNSSSNQIKKFVDDFVSRVNANVGTLQTVTMPINTSVDQSKNLTATLTEGNKAVFLYKNNLEETTRVVVSLNEDTKELNATVTTLGANYGRLAAKQAKEQQEVAKHTAQAIQEGKQAIEKENQSYWRFDETVKKTQADINALGQRMMNLSTSTNKTESLNLSYNQVTSDYEHLLKLQRQFTQAQTGYYSVETGVNIPPRSLQEQQILLGQIQQAIIQCSQSYGLYNQEIRYANQQEREQVATAKRVAQAQQESARQAALGVKLHNQEIEEEDKKYINLAHNIDTVNVKISSLGQQMANLQTPTKSTNSSSLAYNTLISQYEQLLNLRRQLIAAQNGTYSVETGFYIPPRSLQEQYSLLSRINALIGECSESYKVYNQEVEHANTANKEQQRNTERITKQNQQMALLATNIQKAQVQVQALAKNWSAIKNNPELNTELQRLIASSKQLSTSADLKQFNAELNTFKARCRSADVATKTWADSFKAAWKNFSFFFGASRIIYTITTRMKELVVNVQNLNSAMIELRKVTDETEDSYDRFLTKAKANSKEVGMGLSEYVNATADFARLGYSVSESNKLAKVAAMYKNVADDMDSVETGTNTLISTMKAFNIESEDAVSIVDKLNAVSNAYAVTSGNLGEGLSDSAASMSIAGNTLDETIALLTAGTEITQDASGMGNTLKVVSMRIRGMKGELEALGEDVDENVESVSKMQTQILNLTHGKVNIFDNNGDFKSLYEILQGISSVYKDLSSTEQANLLETIAGKHRGNAVAAMLTNWSTAQDALTTSLDSAGSAAKENEKYMQGLEGHLQQLQSTWESLSSTLVDDDTLINLVSVGTGVISTIDGIASSIGGLNTIIAGVGIGVFLKNFKNIKAHVELTSKALDSAKNIVNQYGVTTELSGTAIMQYRTALEGLSASEQKVILTKIGLNQQQIETILGLNQQTTATTALTLTEMQQIAADRGLTSEQMNKIRQFTLGNLVIEGQTTATNELTRANLTLLASELNLNNQQTQYIFDCLKVKAANEGVSKSTKGLGISLGSFFKSPLGVISIITTAFTVITSIINAVKQQQEEAYNKVIEKSEEATSHIQNVEQAWSQYLELDTSATEEEKRNALEAVNQQLDNKIKNLQDATKAEKDYADAVRNSAKEDYNKAASDANAAAVAAKEKISGQWNSDYTREVEKGQANDENVYHIIQEALGSYLSIEQEYNPYNNAEFYYIGESKNHSIIDTSNIEELLKYYDSINQAISLVEQKALELGDTGDELLNSSLYKELLEISINNEDNIADYTDNKIEAIYQSAMGEHGLPATVEEFNNLRNAMLQQVGTSETLRDEIEEKLASVFPTLSQEAQKTSGVLSNLDFAIDDKQLSDQIESHKESLKGIAETYQDLAGVVEDYNTNGYLTLENLETIVTAGDEYIDTLFNEEGQIELNKNAYVKLAKAKLEDIRYSMLQSAISDINSLNKDSETTAVDELANSTQNLTEQTLMLCAAKKIEEGISPDVVYQYIETYSKYSTIIDNVSNSLDTATDEVFGFEKANEKSTDVLEAQKKALEDTKDALEAQKDGLEDSIDSLQSLVDLVTEYITKNKELEKETLEKQKETLGELIDKRKEELELLQDEIESNKTLAEKQNTVAQNALAYSIAQLDDSGAGKKAQKETGDALAESRTDLQDYLTEQSFDTRLKELEELQESNDEFYDKQIEVIEEYLDNERKLYEDACTMIDNDNGELYGNLLRYVNTYTTTSEAEFNHLWDSAKTAIDKYNGANESTIQLLNGMQGYIYNLTDQIAVFDGKIENISGTIDSVGDNISGIADGINANADALSNFTDKYQSLVSLLESYNWEYEYKGINYFSRQSARDDAVSDILSQIYKNTKQDLPSGVIYGGIKSVPKYARGTRSANGGLSITQENGYEFIPTSIGNGEYTVLDRGNPVFNATATRNLYDLANNPRDFLSSVLWDTNKSFGGDFVSNTSVVSPTIHINVQGDATQSTVNALKSEADKIIKQATNNVMNIALRNKNLI